MGCVLLPSAGHVNHWLAPPGLGEFGGIFFCPEIGGKEGKSDLYLQEHCTELSPHPSDPSRPKLNPFYKQALSPLGDLAWIRKGKGRL